MLNKQDIFDRVVAHLLTQGKPAATPIGKCCYRLNGTKLSKGALACGIGALIPDDLYDERLEDTAANASTLCYMVGGDNEALGTFPVIRAMGLNPGELDGDGFSFIGNIQSQLHDTPAHEAQETGADFVNLVKSAARDFAARWELTLPEALREDA